MDDMNWWGEESEWIKARSSRGRGGGGVSAFVVGHSADILKRTSSSFQALPPRAAETNKPLPTYDEYESRTL